MSSDPSTNLRESAGESHGEPQHPNNFRPQSPFIPPNQMQFPNAGLYAEWLTNPNYPSFQQHSTPLQFPHNQPYMGHGDRLHPTYSGPAPFSAPPYYQQNSQTGHLNRSQPTYLTPPPLVAPTGGYKNWTSEEDVQLCRAWIRVVTDPAVGVGQKKEKLWERVRDLFHQLMQEKHKQNSTRNVGACENRMGDLKSLCSKWSAIRAKAFQLPASGSALHDSELLARQMWEDENNGKPFRHFACWDVLKECPKWVDYSKKRKSTDSTSQTYQGASQPPLDAYILDSVTAESASNTQRPQTPTSDGLGNSPTGVENDRTSRGAECTPILDGPASIDVERPPGTKKSKKTLKARKKEHFSEAQNVACETFRAGLENLQASTTARWEKSMEERRRKDEINNQVLVEDRRMAVLEHGLNVVNKRIDLADKLEALTEKLGVAVQRLDATQPEGLMTPNQKMLYKARLQVISALRAQCKELNEALAVTHNVSPLRTQPAFNNSSASGTSHRRLDYEDGKNNVVVSDNESDH